MAIVIRGLTDCSICGKVLEAGAELVMTPHFIHDELHPLWRYSDSGMHAACFAAWEHAEDFRAAFNAIWPTLMPDHPREMLADGRIVER